MRFNRKTDADQHDEERPEGTVLTAPVPPVPAATPGGQRTMRIGELLISRGLLTDADLDHALAEQSLSGRRLGAEIIALGLITERQLIEVLADQLHLPVADLRSKTPEPDAVHRMPEEVARRLEAVPLRMMGDIMEVALADILSDQLRGDLEEASSCRIVGVLAPPSEIRLALDRAYLAIDGVGKQVESFTARAQTRAKVEMATLQVDADAPVVQVVSMLLTQAMRDRASDIHIEPQPGKVRIRFRVDGVMRQVTELPEEMAQSLVSRIKVMAKMDIVERRRPQDGQITTDVEGRPLDIRVSTVATVFGEKAVLRLLDKTKGLLSLAELGMPADTSDEMSRLVTSPFGMVLVAGPTGSGKTTTLYAALNAIDDPTRNITTIEDPVEYVVPTINQVQVNPQADVTFADGLRSLLRQDPDVILIGEIRDIETARIAVQGALTGHLVLSSVHATDTATAVQRFRDMGVEPFLMTSALLAVASQRLVRQICNHCREEYQPAPAEIAFYESVTGETKERYFHGAGCNLCSQTGYSQRVGIYELLRMTDTIRELILRDAGAGEIRAAAIAEGMRTLRDEVMSLVHRDITTIAEAVRTVSIQ
jgi:type IV pilus assembly protein PilB